MSMLYLHIHMYVFIRICICAYCIKDSKHTNLPKPCQIQGSVRGESHEVPDADVFITSKIPPERMGFEVWTPKVYLYIYMSHVYIA